MSVITLAEYKIYAGINNPSGDLKLQPLVDYVNDLVTQFCNTSFSPSVVYDERQSISSTEVILRNAPLVSVEEVRVLQGKTVLSTIPQEDIYLEAGAGIIQILSGIVLPSTPLNISIDYTYGYSEPPASVKLSAMELITHLSKREFNKSRNLGNGETATYSDPSILPSHIRTGLELYRVL